MVSYFNLVPIVAQSHSCLSVAPYFLETVSKCFIAYDLLTRYIIVVNRLFNSAVSRYLIALLIDRIDGLIVQDQQAFLAIMVNLALCINSVTLATMKQYANTFSRFLFI